MYNSDDILLMIKKAAFDLIAANKPVEISYGKVETEVPLQIRVDEKSLINEVQFALCRNVTDYDVQLTETDLGTRTYNVKNALVQGEKVILFRFQGGQKYLVLDRVV